MEKILYTAHATATGGREGHVVSSDGVLNLDVRIPKEMGGSGGAFSNPEQLFAAGYAACFDSALNHIIRGEKVQAGTTKVTAEVNIGPNGKAGFELSVVLNANVPGVDAAKAKELVDKAHQVCPYSNATRGNITVALNATNE